MIKLLDILKEIRINNPVDEFQLKYNPSSYSYIEFPTVGKIFVNDYNDHITIYSTELDTTEKLKNFFKTRGIKLDFRKRTNDRDIDSFIIFYPQSHFRIRKIK